MSFWIDFKNVMRDYGIEYWNRYYASYRGFVHDNVDPDKLGRIQLKVPQIHGENVHKYWAWSKGMPSGKGIGLFLMPNKGDQVWVEFENGDPRYPIWSYGHWNGINKPQAQMSKDDKPTNMVWASTSGHLIELDDKDGSESIRITDKFGHALIMKQGFISFEKHGDKISLGTDGGSDQKAVLGDKQKTQLDKLFDQLDALCTALLALTVSTALGPSGTAINAAQIQAVQQQLALIKADLPQTLSTFVTLD